MLTCPVCGEANPERARFCLACGTPLQQALAGEERKVVSVLFVDLAGFTARSDEADPEDVRALLRPYHARLKQEIERYGGTVEKFIGDAVMAVFGAPVAHEDDAERGVRAALRIADAIEELNDEQPGLDLSIRAAVNTGPAVVSLGARPERGEGIATGDVVNTASRMQQAAPLGAVVVGEATYRTTRQMFEYDELEPVTAKGKAEPIAIWRARAARSRFGVDVDRRASPFIGRDEDLAVLRQVFARMLRERSVQLVTVAGEPGVGKSRIVEEFFGWVDDQSDLVFWRQGRCLPYGDGITFWALGEIVKAQAGIVENDDPRDAASKLARSVAAVIDDAKEREWVAARLSPLVGASGEMHAAAEREETFAAWRTFLEAVAAQRPLVVVFEDLHWADEPLLEFLDHLTDWATDVPMLIVCSARPELYERMPGWGGGKRNSTTISLSPLSRDDSARLVAALLDQAVLPAETQALLLERAGGNPLYAEEFVRMLVDRGLLDDHGSTVRVDDDAEIPVPDSVQAIIAARLDAVGPEQKSLLHDAAVVGKVFWSGALATIGGVDEVAVREGLHDLARRELVRPARRSSVDGQAEYAFWHLFIRDVAYEQIPRAMRAGKHRAAAEWIERIAGERASDQAELIAHHFGQALELARASGETGELAELEERTVRYLILAGERAARLDAERARRHYAEALELLPSGHPERGSLLLKDAGVTVDLGRLDEAETELREAITAFRDRGDPLGTGEALSELSNATWNRGDTAGSWKLLREAVELLEGLPPGRELALAYLRTTGAYMMSGLADEGMPWAEKALALAQTLGIGEYVARVYQFRGVLRCIQGDLAGMDDLRESLRRCEELGLGTVTAVGYTNLGDWVWFAEGAGAGLEVYRTGVEFGLQRGLSGPVNWTRAQTLWTLFDLGGWDELLATADEVCETDRATGASQVSVMARTYQARVLAERGRIGEAAELLPEFLPQAREIRDPQVLGPALATAALMALANGSMDEARGLVEEFDRVGANWTYGAYLLPDVLRVVRATGDVDLMERITARGSHPAARFRFIALTGRAMIEEFRGDLEAAAASYADAAQRWTDYGFALERGHALLGSGRCLLRLGDPDAAERLRAARDVFVGLGALGPLDETDALVSRATALSS